MQPLSRSLGFAALSALALTVSGSPGYADDFAENLGPVGPNEPILTTVGSKRIIAFYVPGNGHCGINVVVWDRSDASGNSAARVRVSLNPALGTGRLSPGDAFAKQGFVRKGSENVVGPMPPFGQIITTDDKIWKIIAWLRTVHCSQRPEGC